MQGERVAARVRKFKDEPPVAEGVTALNPGFFHLERMRSASTAKRRSKKRAKVRGK